MSYADKDDLSTSFRPHGKIKNVSNQDEKSSKPNYFFIPALKVLIMSFVPLYSFLYIARYNRIYIQRRRMRKNQAALSAHGFGMRWRIFWRTVLFIFVGYPMLRDMFSGLRRPRFYAALIIGFFIFCTFMVIYTPIAYFFLTITYHFNENGPMQFLYYIINPLIFTIIQLLLNKSLQNSNLPLTQEKACQRFNSWNFLGVLPAVVLFILFYISAKEPDSLPQDQLIIKKATVWIGSSKSYSSLRAKVIADAVPYLCLSATADPAKKNALGKYFTPKQGYDCSKQMPAMLNKCVSATALPTGSEYSVKQAADWLLRVVICSDVAYFNKAMMIKSDYFLEQAKTSAADICSTARAKLKNKNTPHAAVMEKSCKDRKISLATSCYNTSKKVMPDLVDPSKEWFYRKQISDCVASAAGVNTKDTKGTKST